MGRCKARNFLQKVSYPIKIFKSAKADFRNATLWYEEQVPGLGERFEKTIFDGMVVLKIKPEIFQKQYDEIHVCFFKKISFRHPLLY